MHLRRFFVAIGSDWLALMSGPLTVPLTFAAFFVSATTYKVLFACLAVLAAGITCYRVWEKEYSRAEAEIAQRGRPQIIISWSDTGHSVNFMPEYAPGFRNVGSSTAHTVRIIPDLSKQVWTLQPVPIEVILPNEPQPVFPILWAMCRNGDKEEKFAPNAFRPEALRVLKGLLETGRPKELIFALRYTGLNPEVSFAEKWKVSLEFPEPRFEPMGKFTGTF
jgi:hypothetical protein